MYAALRLIRKITAKRATRLGGENKDNSASSLRASLLAEEERDMLDEEEGNIPAPLLGKKSHLILTLITLGVCVLMWFFTFGMGMIA